MEHFQKYKLVCFDVDGTLIDNIEYSWELFHNHFEVDKKKRIWARDKYYKGEFSYLDWANHDIGMWVEKGATKQEFIKAMKKIKLMKGALETLRELKKHGLKLAIISGSLNIIVENFIPDYADFFDDVFLSWLYFDEDGKLTRAKVTEFDMVKKADALRKIAEREGFRMDECVHIGDHNNDVEIAKIAGLSIAFDAKDDELRKVADVVINKKDLREVLRYII